MYEIEQTENFRQWRGDLKDPLAAAAIADRIFRLSRGLLGDTSSVGDGVSELRIHTGPGYRIYFQRRDGKIILLLCAGDKSNQRKDRQLAKQLAKQEKNLWP
ncbi:MAG: type II toxin-antitoxin system RelE/ParE family toxin [Candidatus Symbiodolus clandestinus]